MQLAAMILLCGVGHALHLFNLYWANQVILGLKKERRCAELMSFLVHTEDCRDFIRMGPQESIQLCHKLRGTRIVKDNMRSTVEEQVAKFCILLVTMSIIKVCSALSS